MRLRYSTPATYMKTLHAKDLEWPLKVDDFESCATPNLRAHTGHGRRDTGTWSCSLAVIERESGCAVCPR